MTLPQPPPTKKPKTARKDRLTAPLPGGYRSLEPGIDPLSTDHLSLDSLLDSETADHPKLLAYLRGRYGNQAETVIQILTTFEAYGELFHEWRAPWDSDTDEYRAKRALQLARAARDLQKALNSLSNYKQKSWYTHALVWIVWQQIWLYGNVWPLEIHHLHRISEC